MAVARCSCLALAILKSLVRTTPDDVRMGSRAITSLHSNCLFISPCSHFFVFFFVVVVFKCALVHTVWDVVGEAGLYRLRGHKGEITDVKFLFDGRYLVSSSKDTYLKIWELATQHCVQTLVRGQSLLVE